MSVKGPIISIEDDVDDQYIIRQVIRELGVSNDLIFFNNGQEALAYLQTMTEQPFLILCDINMPLMDGIELRERICSDEQLERKSIPFIFLTTAADKKMVRDAYDATVQGFFQKADTYDGLRQQLRLIIEYWGACLHPNSLF